MANNLTALTPTLFSAATEVSAEAAGVLGAISMNFDDKGVAKGDEVTVPVAPTRTAKDFTPAATSSTGDDADADSVKVMITKSRKVDWVLNGEQLRSLQNAESDKDWMQQMMAQGMRTLRNEAEADAALAAKQGASRAIGTAGTVPFASDINLLVDLRKAFVDGGAPMADLQLCCDSSAMANMLKLGVVQQANLAGSDAERRTGLLGKQYGFTIQESAGIATHVKGSGASYVTSGATATGVRDIALVTGAGTVLAGDVVTFAADSSRKYVINQGVTAPGTITIGRPGAGMTIPTANAMTIGNNYTPHVAFERGAVVGVMRPPIIPANPTMQMRTISDKKGLTYLLIEIAQYGQISWELHLAWGFKVVQGEHVHIVMG